MIITDNPLLVNNNLEFSFVFLFHLLKKPSICKTTNNFILKKLFFFRRMLVKCNIYWSKDSLVFYAKSPLGFDSRLIIYKTKKRHYRVSFCFGDPYGNRTHVTAVKGPCLNRLTNGPGSGSRT